MDPIANTLPIPASTNVIGPPPKNVVAFVNRWNRARKDGHRVSAVAITRPSGRVNHHVHLRATSGTKHSVSLGATDDATVGAAIEALLALATASAPKRRP